ncbi:MAG: serine/threonine-protein kinase [Myxococcota bacterium]
MTASDELDRASQLPRAGSTFAGRFSLVRRLAAGGMGAVFEATDAAGTAVAIKVLHPELASDTEIRRRFRRESSILAAIDHPGVVRILDMGTDDRGRSFTVMELLQGETLAEWMERSGALSPEELRPVVHQVCDALSAVHGHGVVHGDLKPANLFLVEEGEGRVAKLVDFGLSKVHGLDRLTRTGEVIGTPAYMAPELLTGDGVPDGRVDTYALGVILYEALANAKPFTERNPGKLMFEIVMGKNIPLTQHGVAPEVAEVVERAMAASRDKRFPTTKELGDAFEAVSQ